MDGFIALKEQLRAKEAKIGNYKKISPTQPKEFKLSKIKPRAIPIPVEIPKQAPPNPIPLSTYHQPEHFESDALEDREHNLKARQAKLLEKGKGLT